MAKTYPLEKALEKATKRVAKEILLLLKMIKKFFFDPPKRIGTWDYVFTRGMWLFFIWAVTFTLYW